VPPTGVPPTVRLVMDSGTHTSSQRSDTELLVAHVAGDRRAFAELFDRHHRRLSRLAGSRSVNAEDAADALQDAMLAAHRGARQFRQHSAVSSWLHRIVVNACVDQARRTGAHRASTLDEEAHVVSDETARVETAILVRGALLALPAEQRAAVLAVDMYGHSIADAARLLGVAEGTVKSRRARARAHLAVVLGPLREPPDGPAGH
jgi:RNA polymerase sigma-70 factor, ECF subfamily